MDSLHKLTDKIIEKTGNEKEVDLFLVSKDKPD